MKIVWSQTGDSLDIELVNLDVGDYWIKQLNCDQKNQFFLTDATIQETQPLVDALTVTNAILKKFKIEPLMDPMVDWLDQNNLNVLHERWVKIQHKHNNIVRIISSLPDNVIDYFHDVNKLIHKIEKSYTITYTNDQWQTPNIFGPDILKFGIWQIELHYQNLGRFNYEKWRNYDTNITDTDTNNFTDFGGTINFNIGHPVVNYPPVNYVKYCQQQNINPYGNKLPLGNFKISITELRHIFNKNVNIKNNTITFEV